VIATVPVVLSGISAGVASGLNAFRVGLDGSVEPLNHPANTGVSAHAINASGMVAGEVEPFDSFAAIATVWSDTEPMSLPGLSGQSSLALAIDDNGVVGGISGQDAAIWVCH
jgi:hypothetical protein